MEGIYSLTLSLSLESPFSGRGDSNSDSPAFLQHLKTSSIAIFFIIDTGFYIRRA